MGYIIALFSSAIFNGNISIVLEAFIKTETNIGILSEDIPITM